MTGELSPQVVLTDKQARFVKYAASGMLMKDAWRQATGSKCTDKSARVAAAKMKRIPGVALALAEVLRSKRLMDLDSVGQVISDTKEDQDAARADKAHASVANYARMRGNWQSMERQNLLFAAESLLSDAELIAKLAGDDPTRRAAAQVLLGVAEGFPEGPPLEAQDAVALPGPESSTA